MDYTVHSVIQVHETRVLVRLDKIVGFLARKRNATTTTIRLVGRIERTVLYICHGICTASSDFAFITIFLHNVRNSFEIHLARTRRFVRQENCFLD